MTAWSFHRLCSALAELAAIAVGPLVVFTFRNFFTTVNLVGKIFAGFYFVGIVAQTYSGQEVFGRYMVPLLMALAPTIVQGFEEPYSQ